MPRGEMREKRRSPERSGRPRKSNAGYFPIHDPSGVASVLGKILSAYWALEWDPEAMEPKPLLDRTKHEQLELAARRFGISYSTFHRLAHGMRPTISWRVASQLEDVVKEFDKESQTDWWTQLEPHLFSPAVQRIQDEYRGYLVRELRALEEKYPETTAALYSGEPELVALKFERRARAMGAPTARIILATRRVYDSVLSWDPLYQSLKSSDDLLKVVRLRYRQELMLLQNELRALHSVS